MDFTIVGNIKSIKVIAVGKGIRELSRIRKLYGRGRWRKLKGIATVRLANGETIVAEVHWYEAHGVGKKELKIKQVLYEE